MNISGRSVCSFLLIAACGFLQSPRAFAAPPVELIGESQLQPDSTLEFRFSEGMVMPSGLGPTTESPVVFTPDLPGTFTWLSTRSGVFVPSGPLPLDGQWKAHLRDDLKRADGKPWDVPFSAVVTTPAFGTTAIQSGVWDASDVSPSPEVRLAFQSPVSLDSARKLFHFVDTNGDRMAAGVRYATSDEYFPLESADDTWELRSSLASSPTATNGADEKREFPARLIVTPTSPLTPGMGWQLTAPAGLSSANSAYRTKEPILIPLGTVQPLRLLTTTPTNYINSGTAAVMSFSRPLAPDITTESAAKFFTIDPPVEGVTFSVDWQQLTIRGDFKLARDYTLRIGKDVVSSDGLAYEGDRDVVFQFRPVAPRVYLPEITGEQLRFGRREFPVRFVNLAALQVTAKRVSTENLPQALAAFANYRKSDWDEENPGEVYQPVTLESLTGETLADSPVDIGKLVPDEAGAIDVDWTKILGTTNPGAVFLSLDGSPSPGIGGRHPGAQALVQLTDLGILWKMSAAGLSLQVFSLQSGKPMAGAKALLHDAAFSKITTATADIDGKMQIGFQTEPAWLTVTSESDALVIRMGAEARELPVWAFGVQVSYLPWSPNERAVDEARGILFTDRPLYRAGETVHVKGIIRRIDDGMLQSAAGLPGRLVLVGTRDEVIETQAIVLNEAGEFSADFIAASARRGEYKIRFKLGDGEFQSWQAEAQTTFLIADYQPDAFAVELKMPEQFPAGAPLPRPVVSGSYFFGAPIADADIRWTLQSSRADFAPEGFENFTFLPSRTGASSVLTLRGEGRLDGTKTVDIPLELPALSQFPTQNRLTVEVTDLNQQTVTADKTFTRDASDFYLGIALPESQVLKVGTEMQVRVAAVKPDGAPTEQPVKISAKWFHIRNDVVRVKGAGNAITFQTDAVRDLVSEAAGDSVTPRFLGEKWDTAHAEGLPFTPTKPGEYLLQITATDPAGREVLSDTTFFVAGPGETVWDYRNPAQIDLIPDKAEYQPGDTARILVKNPISADAIVSIERGNTVLRTFSIRLEGNAPVIEIPITDADAPNIFVSLVAIRGAEGSRRKFPAPEFRYGLCNLNVVQPSDALDVRIDPTKASWTPGQTATAEIVVTDINGKPVPNASVTFFAVDDGVLALTGYERPDPLTVFRAPLPLGVRTGLTLESLLAEDPSELSFFNKGYLIGGGGLGGPGIKFREDLPATICWLPDLKTGADGRVRVEFPAPDALTRYRLVAVASEGITRFGSAESAITISKPLMLLSGLGSFAHNGDTLVARVLVRNQTGANGDVALQLELPAGVEQIDPMPAVISVANGQTLALDVTVRFNTMGTARFEWTAELRAGNEVFSDALAVSIAVGSPMVQLRETYLPALTKSSNDLLDGINPQLSEGTGTVRVAVANTRLVGIGEGASYLETYPFGCAEQTVSSMIPWLTRGLVPVLPEFAKPDEEVRKNVRLRLDRLLSMQQESGGITFWPGGREPSLFASAWTAIAAAKLPGVDVTFPETERSGLLEFLSQSLRTAVRESDPDAFTERALVLYSLSLNGRPEAAYHEALLASAGRLPSEARSLLALAMAQSGGPKAIETATTLLESPSVAAAGYSTFGNQARASAMHLLALSVLTPQSKQIPPLVAELLQQRVNGQWGNTQANAWALLAMEAYYTGVEAAGSKAGTPVSGEIANGSDVTRFQVTKADPLIETTLPFPSQTQPTKLAVTNPKKGTLFGQTTFVVYPPLGVQPQQDRGFSVSRSYQKVSPDGTLLPADDLRVGDRVLVTLRVESSRPASFVAIDDPLPAILEAINPDFVSKTAAVDATTSAPVDFREVLSDRVRFFSDRLPAGAYSYQYLARVRNAGKAIAPAAKAEEMYRPERFGLSEIETLTSTAAK